MRITGGAFAAGRLPDNYYGQFIRVAQAGGMDAVCATEQWSERISANPRNGEYLRSLSPEKFIAVLTRWKEAFEAGAHLPVMGVTDKELGVHQVADAGDSRQRQDPFQRKRIGRAPADSRFPAASVAD